MSISILKSPMRLVGVIWFIVWFSHCAVSAEGEDLIEKPIANAFEELHEVASIAYELLHPIALKGAYPGNVTRVFRKDNHWVAEIDIEIDTHHKEKMLLPMQTSALSPRQDVNALVRNARLEGVYFRCAVEFQRPVDRVCEVVIDANEYDYKSHSDKFPNITGLPRLLLRVNQEDTPLKSACVAFLLADTSAYVVSANWGGKWIDHDGGTADYVSELNETIIDIENAPAQYQSQLNKILNNAATTDITLSGWTFVARAGIAATGRESWWEQARRDYLWVTGLPDRPDGEPETLNVRSQPGSTQQIIGTVQQESYVRLAPGKAVRVGKDTWTPIKWKRGITAWVNRKFLESTPNR